ncbi:MAG: hypothetical protein GF317_08090 [Candidatus Lokiarchaeota archaeon]|nr:hypothetical protein [Candidatus Lokiarchaeota archaeon]MBD3199673.1 hypothetical protein [Candidatus Lokiarchaeota archaeon]
MKIKISIKSNIDPDKSHYSVLIQKEKKFLDDINQLIQFFGDNVQISNKYGIHRYYKISSENPALIFSLITALLEIIPEILITQT